MTEMSKEQFNTTFHYGASDENKQKIKVKKEEKKPKYKF